LIGKVNEPEYMNTDRESQCIKYERDVQLGEATRKARTGKVLRSAQQRISVYQIRKRCAARGGYKESAYRKGLEIGPFQKRVSDYRERLKVVYVRDDCCK
jgi:hypothetical protein